MRQFYMDTNVFISRLKPDDPYHREAESMMKSLERDEIEAHTSVLTLVETASTVSRLYSPTPGKRETPRKRRALIIKALRRLARLKTRFVHIPGDAPLAIKRIDVGVPSLFAAAVLASLQTKLRTLDLIHFAAARYAKQVNRDLGAFVTGDNEFLEQKDELSKIIDMPILSPKEYIEALGIA